MANFELRIYQLLEENLETVAKQYNLPSSDPTDVEDLSDENFVEACEEYGKISSLSNFLGTGVITCENDITRAYFVEVDNGNSKPIRADKHYTVITASKITSNGFGNGKDVNVLFEENKPIPKDKTYTIIITNNDEETSTDDIIHEIETLRDVEKVEVIEEADNKIRLSVDTEIGFEYDTLEETIDNNFMADCEFIEIMFNY